jgi:FkbM family methyltransferase
MIIQKWNKQKNNVQIIEEIRRSEIPLILWGAGKLAEIYVNRFNNLEIKISGIFSEDENDFGKMINHEYIVESFEKIENINQQFNILIAHGYPELKSKYEKHTKVTSIFSLFDIHNFEMSIGDEFLFENKSNLEKLYNSLSDDESKDSFNNYLNARYNNNWNLIDKNIVQWDLIPDFLNLTPNEIVVDCGAYDGDSLSNYLKKIGGYTKYYAIEPDIINFKALKQKADNLQNTYIFNVGVWNEMTELAFINNDDQSRFNPNITDLTHKLTKVNKVDTLCANFASFIKMDIEGAEYEALCGARNTILLNKPKLAISIYHKQIDLFRLFNYINSIRSDYKFYFRIHNKLGVDAILYAI